MTKAEEKAFHKGATAERNVFGAKFRRIEQNFGYRSFQLSEAIEFRKARVKRFRAKKGGL